MTLPIFRVLDTNLKGVRKLEHIWFNLKSDLLIYKPYAMSGDGMVETKIKCSTLIAAESLSDFETKSKFTSAAAGAGLGFLLAGPIGTAVGGLFGGSGSSRKKGTGLFAFPDDGFIVVEIEADGSRYGSKAALQLLSSRLLAQKAVSSPDPSSSADSTKECPACAEDIKIKAKLCRFCGYEFSEAELNDSLAALDANVASAQADQGRNQEAEVANSSVSAWSVGVKNVLENVMTLTERDRANVSKILKKFFPLDVEDADQLTWSPNALYEGIYRAHGIGDAKIFAAEDHEPSDEEMNLLIENAWREQANLTSSVLRVIRKGNFKDSGVQAAFLWITAAYLGPFWCDQNLASLAEFVLADGESAIDIGMEPKFESNIGLHSVGAISMDQWELLVDWFLSKEKTGVSIASGAK